MGDILFCVVVALVSSATALLLGWRIGFRDGWRQRSEKLRVLKRQRATTVKYDEAKGIVKEVNKPGKDGDA